MTSIRKPTIYAGPSEPATPNADSTPRLSPRIEGPLLPPLPSKKERSRASALPTLKESSGSGSSSGQRMKIFKKRFQDDQEKLLEVTRLITSIQEPQKLFDALIRAAAALTGAERGFLMLGRPASTSEAKPEKLELMAAYRLPPALLGEADFSPSRSAISEAFRTGRTIVRSSGGSSDPSRSMQSLGISAVLVEPIVLQGRVLGVLYLDTETSHEFRQSHVRMLPSFAAQAAICLENLRLRMEREMALRIQHAEEIRSRELQVYRETTASLMQIASIDLKAPLTVLRTGLACLKRQSELENREELFHDLENALARAQRVVSDCLDMKIQPDSRY
jgi:K+-sensing histidine kinase KdpD